MEVSQNTQNIELPYDPAVFFLSTYSKEMKSLSLGDFCTAMVISAVFTIAKTQKQPKYPLADEWIKNTWHILIMEYYSVMRKKEMLTFVTIWMNLEDIMLSEII